MTADTRLRDAIAAALCERYFGYNGSGSTFPGYTGTTYANPTAVVLADALLPLVVAEVRSAAEVAWTEGF